ncbi:urease accessory protein UreD [Paenibacillus sp. MMS18-CY102]|uniref:urease accessory protein UreD n=1 Tax=Paenibacillus sp. MMS18-CY102 TaxID=2682849 RepID=UPI001365D189|nr:urease accessory protein UreD [Paenibacillus sp. MMS18-CY102]MWC30467.1 urease accessory protein UreD [Paenibacillus sp. MMS18-CY102]
MKFMRTSMGIPTSTRTLGHGRVTALRASFECPRDRTVMTEKYHNAPIKIAKTFPLGKGVGAIVMDVSPGLLDGDHYELNWQCGDRSRVYVTNQSFTKVHPAGEQNGALLRQSFTLGEGAVMEHMPEPVMLYKGAAFRSETNVTLSQGAIWMQVDVWCPGRTLRGEVFQYARFDSRTRVHYGEELIFAQRQLIEPASQLITVPGSWEKASHIGSFLAFGDRIGAAQLEAVREALAALPNRDVYGIAIGASLTHKHGLAVMAAGTASWPLQEALRSAWAAVRLSVLGEPPQQLLRV